MKIIVATKNKHKVEEINKIAQSVTSEPIMFLSLDLIEDTPKIDENGATFEENALIKARTIAQYLPLPVLADDSGLVIDALGGEPGIQSARYMNLKSDQERNEAVLEKMEGVEKEKRSARFVCSLAYVDMKKEEHTFEGICEGRIATSEHGSGGFGYDPIFFKPELNKTMAELSAEEKNSISHRALAMKKFLEFILDK